MSKEFFISTLSEPFRFGAIQHICPLAVYCPASSISMKQYSNTSICKVFIPSGKADRLSNRPKNASQGDNHALSKERASVRSAQSKVGTMVRQHFTFDASHSLSLLQCDVISTISQKSEVGCSRDSTKALGFPSLCHSANMLQYLEQ